MLEIVFNIRGILNSWARPSTKTNENWIPTNKKYFTVIHQYCKNIHLSTIHINF